MDNHKNDKFYRDKIIENLHFIADHMSETSYEDFAEDEVLQDSMMFRLVQISENAKDLSNEYKENHKAVPWNQIYGLRNRLVHDYGNVDLSIVYDTLTKDIPGLLKAME